MSPSRPSLAFQSLLFAGIISAAQAQSVRNAPLASEQRPAALDSGWVEAEGTGPEVVYSGVVGSPGAPWVQLNFDSAVLGGSPAGGNESRLRLTSVLDGHVQLMNAEHVGQWQNRSAYFNGDAVLVEIIAFASGGPNRVVTTQLTAGVESFDTRTICGPTDDRTLISDPKSGRAVPVGCTTWIFNDANHCMITAGHCAGTSFQTIEFNCPLSTSSGAIVHPPPSDQYAVDPASVQFSNGGLGNDWTYFGCFANSTTGMTPFQAGGGQFYTLAAAPPAPVGQTLRITGYGVTSAPISLTWSQVEKTHTGPFSSVTGTTLAYQVDTTGGNSGSAVVDEGTGLAFGIHTNAGCTSTGGNNTGTAVNNAGLQNALANPQGVCAVPNPPAPPNPTVSPNSCGNRTLTRVGSPPAGVSWYWQGTSCGMRTDLGSGPTLTVSQSGTYYIRAQDSQGLWSLSCGSVLVTVNTSCQLAISGLVQTAAGVGMCGVSVSADNGGNTTTTDSGGGYTLMVPYGWSGRITPMLTGATFTPAFRDYTNVGNDITGESYASAQFADCNSNGTPDNCDILPRPGNLLYDSGPVNVPIPDQNISGISHVISVSQPGVIQDVNVTVHIAHPNVGQLLIGLVHAGRNITLWSSRCSGSSNLDVTFDDQGGILACGNLAGTYRPTSAGGGTLGTFNGLDAQGTWTLRVIDNVSGSVGSLTSWTLNVVIPSFPPVSQDANSNGTPDECECACRGDLSQDGRTDGADVQGFVAAYLSGASGTCADMNGDGHLDAGDLASFTGFLLTGTTACP